MILLTSAGTAFCAGDDIAWMQEGVDDTAACERTVKVLLAAGSSPMIKKNPGKAAYTHAAFEAAKLGRHADVRRF